MPTRSMMDMLYAAHEGDQGERALRRRTARKMAKLSGDLSWCNGQPRGHLSFPWSMMDSKMIGALASFEPHSMKMIEYIRDFCKEREIIDPDTIHPVIMTLTGVSSWLHSSRRLIELSGSSVGLLSAHAPRFEALPVSLGEPWKKGVVFFWGIALLKGLRTREREIVYDKAAAYVEPMEGEEPGIRACLWLREVYGEGSRWNTVVDRMIQPSDFVYDMSLLTYTRSDALYRTPKLGLLEDGTRIDKSDMMALLVNALATLHSDPQVDFGFRKAPRRRGRTGAIRGVKRMTLTEDGVRLVTRRWATLDRLDDEAPNIEHSKHRSMCLHTVNPHDTKVWVKAPKEYERVLDTKDRVLKNGSTSTLFCVVRKRGLKGAYARGSGLRPKQARVVTGVEDL